MIEEFLFGLFMWFKQTVFLVIISYPVIKLVYKTVFVQGCK